MFDWMFLKVPVVPNAQHQRMFEIIRSSDDPDATSWVRVEREINSLEELLAFSDEVGEKIILQRRDGKFRIEIYDDYRE